jgi:hypothetical protein
MEIQRKGKESEKARERENKLYIRRRRIRPLANFRK